MPPAVYLSHPSSLQHDTGAHPERAARIGAIERELALVDWLGYERIESCPVTRELLEVVHTAAHVDAIERLSASGGGAIDADTFVSGGSWEAALHAAGGAAGLVDLLLAGDARCGFSAHRPPGHHAERDRAMGFCLFNNVAAACAHALGRHGLERVLVLDWDVHHGNGTNDIFHASEAVLYVSIHQWPLYPGTGAAEDVGIGAGRGYTVNLPVPPESGDEVFVSLVEHVVGPLVRAYRPQLVLVSAGFDAHFEDPLADCRVTEIGFAAMTASMRQACVDVGAPLGAVLEGGYALDALARSVMATMEELAGEVVEAAAFEGVEVHPVAAAARERVRGFWELG
jgi:acetoin utilization deacetylase AcuC-like enzyme